MSMTLYPLEKGVQVRIVNLADKFDGPQEPEFIKLANIFPGNVQELSLSGNMPIQDKSKKSKKWLGLDHLFQEIKSPQDKEKIYAFEP
jgi:hypothetical protein